MQPHNFMKLSKEQNEVGYMRSERTMKENERERTMKG